MSEFLDILTHGRRLQGAVKDLSVEELVDVAEKLNSIIEKRKEKEAEIIQAEKEKQAKLEAIRKQLEEAGLAVEDLAKVEAPKKSKAAGKKRPVKYSLTDESGNEVTWTGIGRMPKAYAKALAEGKSLESFAI